MKSNYRRTAHRWRGAAVAVGMTSGGFLATALMVPANAPAAGAVADDGQSIALADDNPFAVFIGSPAGDTITSGPDGSYYVPLDLADQALPQAVAAQLMPYAQAFADDMYGTILPDLTSPTVSDADPFAGMIGAPDTVTTSTGATVALNDTLDAWAISPPGQNLDAAQEASQVDQIVELNNQLHATLDPQLYAQDEMLIPLANAANIVGWEDAVIALFVNSLTSDLFSPG